MLDLKSVGMSKGMLYETIITTTNPDKTPNAAPIGVICKSLKEVVVYLHEGSHTVRNIKNNGEFIVNILKDPLLFVESTMEDLDIDNFMEYEDNYSIRDADAFFKAKVVDLKEVEREDQFGISRTSIVRADVGEIIINKECPEPLNRAIYGVLESLVYLSRKEIVSGKTEELYNMRMKEISRIVNKVGASEHKQAIKKVMNAWNEE
ncbi:MAG: DUF447 family protein [Methanobacterium sp.]|nr:DUF447 family protein [Methanobacterium sp.]